LAKLLSVDVYSFAMQVRNDDIYLQGGICTCFKSRLFIYDAVSENVQTCIPEVFSVHSWTIHFENTYCNTQKGNTVTTVSSQVQVVHHWSSLRLTLAATRLNTVFTLKF